MTVDCELVPSDAHLERARLFPLLLMPSDVEDAVVAVVPDIPHLIGVGDTPEEAVADAVKGIAATLAFLEEAGQPAPDATGGASGLFQVRAPKSLHRALQARATAEGVSVNAVVNHLLTRALALEEVVGLPTPRKSRRGE